MQVAEMQAQQLQQEAAANSPTPSGMSAAAAAPPSTSQTSAAAPSSLQTPAAAATQSQPAAVAASAILPAARLLSRVQVAKAEALAACGAALQGRKEDSASYAVPGKDAAVVKQFLAQAGMLVQIAYTVVHCTCLHLLLAGPSWLSV